jgi:hypothetical protein
MANTNTTKKAAGASNTNGLHIDTNDADFLTDVASQQAPDHNAIANQIGRIALAGHVVHGGSMGDFTVTKWGQALIEIAQRELAKAHDYCQPLFDDIADDIDFVDVEEVRPELDPFGFASPMFSSMDDFETTTNLWGEKL